MLFGVLFASLCLTASADDLAERFANPPEQTKPRCYWYWIDGHISREGITRDLEAMRRIGIGESYIGIIGGGEVKALSEPWWALIEHAVREGGRIGVDIGVFNCPGWSQSGGPWVQPGQSMRYVATAEVRVRGPRQFAEKLPAPAESFQDIAVLAFPSPAGDDESAKIASRTPSEIAFETPKPFTARSVTVVPVKAVRVESELQASDDGQNFRTVKKFPIDRHNLGVNVGPKPLAPIVASFPAVTARFFRLKFSANCEVGDVRLSPAARVEGIAEKSLSKMFQDPLPPFDFYSWPTAASLDRPALSIPTSAVQNISKHKAADGTLNWSVPPGDWILLRLAAVPTGVKNSPAPPEATGLEVDKMNREALRSHFDAYVGKLLARIPEKDRTALKHVVADSYEMGPQNWTDDFAADFQRRYGYDPLPFMPVLTGRLVGGADQSDRFLWDVRRMVADRVARDYVGGLRDLCRERGLKMWLENYGHWGFPAEFLQYGGSCDEISGEFWADGNLGGIELRDAASAAHTYGMTTVWAEAFTGGPAFRSMPGTLKARGDWALCEGINQFVLHVYIHQPWEDRRPGVNAWFGTEFNRHNTWFEKAKPWIDYHRRCSVLLQSGRHVADVAYFIGEDAPKMAGQRKPELPPGYDFDYINADVIQNRLAVRDGRFVLPDGMSYRLLVLPTGETMRPGLLKNVGELAAAGGAVLGPPPKRSPSLQDYPKCDAEVQKMAAALWGEKKILESDDLASVLDRLHTTPDVVGPPDVLWKHRRDGDCDIYFLSNQKPASRTETISFRVADRAPELWRPDSGQIERPAVYDLAEGRIRVPIRFEPHDSVFVVFRERASNDRVVQVTRNGQPLVDWSQTSVAQAAGKPGTFTVAVWAKPDADTTLLAESNAGVRGMKEPRNEVFAAPHGNTFAPDGTHAGAGLSIGRNGVAVFEHGSGYFAPVLVHAAKIADWTHVAIVYREGRPSLFLNGRLVHQGLQSTHVVHSGVTAAGASASFTGQVGPVESIAAALDAAEIVQRMNRMAKSAADDLGAPIKLARNEAGQTTARVRQPGNYAWKTAAGATRSLDVPERLPTVELSGAWQVRFDPRCGGPQEPVDFAALIDWTKHAEESIRHYSGTAEYRKSFTWSAVKGPVCLSLGDVRGIARVSLNGRELATLWKQPYRLDVTDAIRPGLNTLEIEVTNTWLNRLLGDDPLEAANRRTFATQKTWKGPPQPSGLLGPVLVRHEVAAP